VTGYLCDVGDTDRMAAKSIELLSDEDKLEQFRINARHKALEFSRDEIVPQYEKIYQSCLDEL